MNFRLENETKLPKNKNMSARLSCAPLKDLNIHHYQEKFKKIEDNFCDLGCQCQCPLEKLFVKIPETGFWIINFVSFSEILKGTYGKLKRRILWTFSGVNRLLQGRNHRFESSPFCQ